MIYTIKNKRDESFKDIECVISGVLVKYDRFYWIVSTRKDDEGITNLVALEDGSVLPCKWGTKVLQVKKYELIIEDQS